MSEYQPDQASENLDVEPSAAELKRKKPAVKHTKKKSPGLGKDTVLAPDVPVVVSDDVKNKLKKGAFQVQTVSVDDQVFKEYVAHWRGLCAAELDDVSPFVRPEISNELQVLFRWTSKGPPSHIGTMCVMYIHDKREMCCLMWMTYSQYGQFGKMQAFMENAMRVFHSAAFLADSPYTANGKPRGVLSWRIIFLGHQDSTDTATRQIVRFMTENGFGQSMATGFVFYRRVTVCGVDVVLCGAPDEFHSPGSGVETDSPRVMMYKMQEDGSLWKETFGTEVPMKNARQLMQDDQIPRVRMFVKGFDLCHVYSLVSTAMAPYIAPLYKAIMEYMIGRHGETRNMDKSVLHTPKRTLCKAYRVAVSLYTPKKIKCHVNIVPMVSENAERRRVYNNYPLLVVFVTCDDIKSRDDKSWARPATLENFMEYALGLPLGSFHTSDENPLFMLSLNKLKLTSEDAASIPGMCSTDPENVSYVCDGTAPRFMRFAIARHIMDHAPALRDFDTLGSSKHLAMTGWHDRVTATPWRSDAAIHSTLDLRSMGVSIPATAPLDMYWTEALVCPDMVKSPGGADQLESDSVAVWYDSAEKKYTCTHVTPSKKTLVDGKILAHVPVFTAQFALDECTRGALGDVVASLASSMPLSSFLHEENSLLREVSPTERGELDEKEWEDIPGYPSLLKESEAKNSGYFHPWTSVTVGTLPVKLARNSDLVTVERSGQYNRRLVIHPFVEASSLPPWITRKPPEKSVRGSSVYIGRAAVFRCVLWAMACTFCPDEIRDSVKREILGRTSAMEIIHSACEILRKSSGHTEEKSIMSPVDEWDVNMVKLVDSTHGAKDPLVSDFRLPLESVGMQVSLAQFPSTLVETPDAVASEEYYTLMRKAIDNRGVWPNAAIRTFMCKKIDMHRALRFAEDSGYTTMEHRHHDSSKGWTIATDHPEESTAMALGQLIGNDIEELKPFTPDRIKRLCADFSAHPFYMPTDLVVLSDN